MSTLVQRRMTVDQFLVWAEGQDGRWELHNGVPYAMSPQRMRHAKVKFTVQLALLQAIRKAGLPCHMVPDGLGVRISQHVLYEPDAQVYCGAEMPGDAIEVPNPLIVVEVASPSTRGLDTSAKLSGYFSLPSVQHYLIVDPEGAPVIHHGRQAEGPILTCIVHEGVLSLTPPGIQLDVAEMFPPA